RQRAPGAGQGRGGPGSRTGEARSGRTRPAVRAVHREDLGRAGRGGLAATESGAGHLAPAVRAGRTTQRHPPTCTGTVPAPVRRADGRTTVWSRPRGAGG